VLANYHDAPFRELVVVKSRSSQKDNSDPFASNFDLISSKYQEAKNNDNNGADETQFSLLSILSPVSQLHSAKYLKDLFELRKSLGIQSYSPNENVSGFKSEDTITIVWNTSNNLKTSETEEDSSIFSSPYLSEQDKLLYDLLKDVTHTLKQGDQELFIHNYILFARCPFLFQEYLMQKTNSSTKSDTVDVGAYISSQNDWNCFSILVDYLYIGYPAINLLTMKYYTLLLTYSSLSSAQEKLSFIQSLSSFLSSLVLSTDTPDQSSSSKDGSAKVRGSSSARDSPKTMTILKLCHDVTLWRQSKVLINRLTDLLMKVFSFGKTFELPELQNKCESTLISFLSPVNCLQILEWAEENQLKKSMNCCLKYLANHNDIVSLPQGQIARDYFSNSHGTSPALKESYAYVVRQLEEFIQKNFVRILTKPEFYNEKYNYLLKMKRIRKMKIANLTEGEKELNEKEREKCSQLATLAASEEMPYLAVYQPNPQQQEEELPSSSPIVSSSSSEMIPNTISAVTLPKMVGHSAFQFKNSIYFVGGMNRERFFSLSRILAYDIHEDSFRYLATDASKGPVNANLNFTFVLDPLVPSTVVMMGGKLRLAPQQKDCQEILLSEKMRNYENHNLIWSLGKHTTQSLTSMVTGKESKGSSKEGGSISPAPAKSYDQIFEDSVNGKLDEKTDFIFEFHIPTLTWNRKAVQHLPTARFQQNSTMFTPNFDRTQVTRDDLSNAFRKRLAQSIVPIYASSIPYRCHKCLFRDRSFVSECNCLNGKASSSSTTITPERNLVSYALQFGGYCINEDVIKNDLHLLICKNKCEEEKSSNNTLLEADQYQYEWMKLKIHIPNIANNNQNTDNENDQPAERFGHKGVFIPSKHSQSPFISASPDVNPLSLTSMARIFYFGGVRAETFDDVFLSLRINSVEYKEKHQIEEDLTWEPVKRMTQSPRKRHDHSFTFVHEGNFCLLFGGMYSTAQGHVCLNDLWALHWHVNKSTSRSSLFSSLTGSPPSVPQEELVIRWDKISYEGIPPSVRSKHAAVYMNSFPSTGAGAPTEASVDQGSLFIFGGIDEGRVPDQNNNNTANTPPELQFDEKQCDAMIHVLQWKMIKKDNHRKTVSGFSWVNKFLPSSRFMNIDCCTEDYVPLLPDCLSADMRKLSSSNQDSESESRLNSGINPDFAFIVDDRDDDEGLLINRKEVEEEETDLGVKLSELQLDIPKTCLPSSSLTFRSFSSLLSKRCFIIQRMLQSEMIESQTKQIHLNKNEINLNSFRIFLFYLLSDLLLFGLNSSCSSSFCDLQDRNLLQEIIDLIQLSKFYSSNGLMKKCEGLLLSLISESTVMDILSYADLMNLEMLTMACYHFIFKNIDSSARAQLLPRKRTISAAKVEKSEEILAEKQEKEQEDQNEVEKDVFHSNLSILLSDEICNQDFILSTDEMEGSSPIITDVKEDPGPTPSKVPLMVPLVDNFKYAPKELKQKFRDFASKQVHVYLYDVWESQQQAM
jgi:hypothetical protein